MRARRYSSALLWVALLAMLPVAALAQRPDVAQADQALRRAEAIEARMQSQPVTREERAEAARLHIRSAELRAPEDPKGVESLRRAATLLEGQNPAEAARLMGRAADRAAAVGDVAVAAEAYLDAAYGLSHCRPGPTPGTHSVRPEEMEQIRAWVEKARLLSFSRYLTETQREHLTRRLGAGCIPQ